MKTTKLKIIAATVMLLGLNGQAYAQWYVIDPANIAQATISAVQTTLTAGYTWLTAQSASATGNKVGQVNESIGAMTKQSVLNVEATGAQMRSALGEQYEAQKMIAMIPKLDACAEASENQKDSVKNSAVAAAGKSTRGGSQGAPARAANVTSTAAAMGGVLKDKKDLGTCHAAIAGVAGCPDVPAAAPGSPPAIPAGQPYARADTEPRGIKGDVKNLTSTNESANNEAAFNNFTFDSDSGEDKGFKIALKYANDATLYDPPKVANKEALKKNPAYAAIYESMMTKLNASNDALTDIIKMRRKAEDKTLADTIISKEWQDLSPSDYQKMTGNKKKPTKNPSMYEMMNFQVMKDYLGSKDVEDVKDTNKRLALNNYLLLNSYKQQENTNILLAHILVQLTTPMNKATVDAEFNKTMSYAPKTP